MKTLFKLSILALLFASCDEVEPTIYNGNAATNPTLLGFSASGYSLPVERNSTGSVDVILNSSTVSNVDRTYNIEVIPGTGSNAANPATYTVPATVTIPAGSYQGTLTITGQDNNLVDENIKIFTIRLAETNGANIDNDIAQISIFEVCALLDDFTGNYEMDQLSAIFAPAGVTALDEGVKAVTVGSNPFERVFTAEPYPGFGLPEQVVRMSFTCDGVFLARDINTGIGCSGNNIQFVRSTIPGTYNTADDTVFELRFVENSTNSCGASPIQARFRFTKLN